jgi:alkanesulfonate monooxygenase SsuD/methylene tetrahydromethanopterin reductase-like flavin-dependent oxidoreductase (luciferase family)
MKFGVRASEGSVGFEESVRQVTVLDALGFYTVFVGHHYGYADYWSSPMTVLAAYATATECIRLGAAILILPLLPRLQVANDLLSLDEISGGQAILGVAAGWGRRSSRHSGSPSPNARVGWRTGAADKDGSDSGASDVPGELLPAGRFSPNNRAGFLSLPATVDRWQRGYRLRLAAELDAAWLPPTVMSLAGLQTHFGVLTKERGASGPEQPVLRELVLASTSVEAWDQAERYLGASMTAHRAKGSRQLAKVKGSLRDLARSCCMVGDSQECRDSISQYAELGVAQLILKPSARLAANAWVRQMTQFAEEVMPAFATVDP